MTQSILASRVKTSDTVAKGTILAVTLGIGVLGVYHSVPSTMKKG